VDGRKLHNGGETAEFFNHATRVMSDSEHEALVAFVGRTREGGEIMPETGGVRKLRWAREGMGKRGAARVIYYYHGERLRYSCLPSTRRSGRTTSAKTEGNAMKRLVPILAAGYPRKKYEKDTHENRAETEGEKPDSRREHHRGTRSGHRVDARGE